MVIYIDIDETICFHENSDPSQSRDYAHGKPIIKNIEKANRLYDNGNTVVYWTARGACTGIDWHEITENQLKEWGCKYNELKLDKPHYDLFIDDKVMNVRDWA